jgi:hypothetical protein
MRTRLVRMLVLVAMTVFTSGIAQVVAAALDEDCCVEACDRARDGKHCPPHCDACPCAKVLAITGAVVAHGLGTGPMTGRAVPTLQASPDLPLVVAGVFQPPRV